MSIGLSKTTAASRPAASKAASFVRATQTPGDHLTPALTVPPRDGTIQFNGQPVSVKLIDLRATVDCTLADLNTPGLTVVRHLERSFDGVNWLPCIKHTMTADSAQEPLWWSATIRADKPAPQHFRTRIEIAGGNISLAAIAEATQ